MKLEKKKTISNLNDVQAYYDGIFRSRSSTQERTKRYMKLNKWVLDVLKVEKGKKFLDVSCGNGHLLNLAESHGLKTYGIDISKVAVANAKKRALKSLIVAGAGENIPYPSNFFDYVTCMGSLEHFLSPEKGCQEMARVLKNDGLSCIYVPNTYWISHVLNAWFRGTPPTQTQDIELYGTKLEWQELLENNGLRVIKLAKFNLTPINLSFCFTFICKKQ